MFAFVRCPRSLNPRIILNLPPERLQTWGIRGAEKVYQSNDQFLRIYNLDRRGKLRFRFPGLRCQETSVSQTCFDIAIDSRIDSTTCTCQLHDTPPEALLRHQSRNQLLICLDRHVYPRAVLAGCHSLQTIHIPHKRTSTAFQTFRIREFLCKKEASKVMQIAEKQKTAYAIRIRTYTKCKSGLQTNCLRRGEEKTVNKCPLRCRWCATTKRTNRHLQKSKQHKQKWKFVYSWVLCCYRRWLRTMISIIQSALRM